MPTFDNAEDALVHVMDIVSQLNRQVIELKGENIVMHKMIRRLALFSVYPDEGRKMTWDAAIAETRKEWSAELDSADEPTRVFIETALKRLSDFEMSQFDEERPVFTVVEGGRPD